MLVNFNQKYYIRLQQRMLSFEQWLCTAYNCRGTTPLFEAIAESNVSFIEWLMRMKGVDLNRANLKGVTLEQVASQVGNDSMVRSIR
jgi:hypothetical protein